jgi:hypothetical protein
MSSPHQQPAPQPSAAPPAEDENQLLERISALARRLGIEWSGPGGVFPLAPAPGQPARWRVYSEWAGTGATAEVDVSSGELLCIEDAAVEAIAPAPDLPAAHTPREAELIAFVKAQAAAVGWPTAGRLAVRWDAQARAWNVSSCETPAGEFPIQAVVAGSTRRLRLVKMARQRP